MELYYPFDMTLQKGAEDDRQVLALYKGCTNMEKDPFLMQNLLCCL